MTSISTKHLLCALGWLAVFADLNTPSESYSLICALIFTYALFAPEEPLF